MGGGGGVVAQNSVHRPRAHWGRLLPKKGLCPGDTLGGHVLFSDRSGLDGCGSTTGTLPCGGALSRVGHTTRGRFQSSGTPPSVTHSSQTRVQGGPSASGRPFPLKQRPCCVPRSAWIGKLTCSPLARLGRHPDQDESHRVLTLVKETRKKYSRYLKCFCRQTISLLASCLKFELLNFDWGFVALEAFGRTLSGGYNRISASTTFSTPFEPLHIFSNATFKFAHSTVQKSTRQT